MSWADDADVRPNSRCQISKYDEPPAADAWWWWLMLASRLIDDDADYFQLIDAPKYYAKYAADGRWWWWRLRYADVIFGFDANIFDYFQLMASWKHFRRHFRLISADGHFDDFASRRRCKIFRCRRRGSSSLLWFHFHFDDYDYAVASFFSMGPMGIWCRHWLRRLFLQHFAVGWLIFRCLQEDYRIDADTSCSFLCIIFSWLFLEIFFIEDISMMCWCHEPADVKMKWCRRDFRQPTFLVAGEDVFRWHFLPMPITSFLSITCFANMMRWRADISIMQHAIFADKMMSSQRWVVRSRQKDDKHFDYFSVKHAVKYRGVDSRGWGHSLRLSWGFHFSFRLFLHFWLITDEILRRR